MQELYAAQQELATNKQQLEEVQTQLAQSQKTCDGLQKLLGDETAQNETSNCDLSAKARTYIY